MHTAAQETATAPIRRVDTLLAHYAESHRHPVNEAIHCVAIPAIMFSLLGLVYSLHPWAAYAFLGLSLLYYLRLGTPLLTACMVAWSLLLLVGVQAMGSQAPPWSLGIFIVAWVLQFIGHKIEGKKPSFFEDLQYLFIGPLFVLTLLLRAVKIRW